jgi:hypothetical protein
VQEEARTARAAALAPDVFAGLRSLAFNILKANQTDALSQNRYRAGLANIKELLRMLAVS